MGVRLVVLCVTALFVATNVFCVKAQNSAGTALQRQIDELKAGQQQVLRELAEIKQLLQEGAAKAEVGARPTPATNLIVLNLHGEPFRGATNARVAVIEFSDFNCTFCGKFVREIYPRLDKEYIQSGKVKFLFHDLPEPGQTNSVVKARAARCAGEQGKFWEMHDRLFASQSAPALQDVSAHARALELDVPKFEACMASGKYVEAIRRSAMSAGRMGIYGTPAFAIGTLDPNGDFFRGVRVVVGGDSYQELQGAIEETLAAVKGGR